jgi:hypothetical protein
MTPSDALLLTAFCSFMLFIAGDDFSSGLGLFGLCAVLVRLFAVACGWPL